jgi:tetratricopeptide (TPR) repeat protein
VGKTEEAIQLHQQANRLCPFPPSYYYLNLGNALMAAGRYEEAIQEYQKTLHLTPRNFFAFFGLTTAYGLSGQEEQSRAAAQEMMTINPRVTLQSLRKK